MFQALESNEPSHARAAQAAENATLRTALPSSTAAQRAARSDGHAGAEPGDAQAGNAQTDTQPRDAHAGAQPRDAQARPDRHPAGDGVGGLTLDALLALPASQLQILYRQAEVPQIEVLSGDLRGRMLDNVLFGGPLARWLGAFAATDVFPWRGKSFAAYASGAGEGINRILSDRLRRFGFSTFVGRSRAGHFDAVQLDYDRPENPWLIRMVKDEIRQLRPGLFLGQAYFAYPHEQLVLYFGLTSDGLTSDGLTSDGLGSNGIAGAVS